YRITQGVANRQVARIDAAALTQEVRQGFRSLVVHNGVGDILNAISLATDNRLNTCFIHCRVIGDAFEDFAESDHFSGFKAAQVNYVMQTPEHVGGKSHELPRIVHRHRMRRGHAYFGISEGSYEP